MKNGRKGLTEAEATKRLRSLAEQGDAEAQFSLSIRYQLKDKGVPEDKAIGYMLVSLAAANGHKDATKLKSHMEQTIPHKEIARGQELAAVWKRGMPLPLSSL